MEIDDKAEKAIGDIVARIQQGKVQLEGQLKNTIAQKEKMLNQFNNAIAEMTAELNDMNDKFESLKSFIPEEPEKTPEGTPEAPSKEQTTAKETATETAPEVPAKTENTEQGGEKDAAGVPAVSE